MIKIAIFALLILPLHTFASDDYVLSYKTKAGFGKTFKMTIEEKRILVSGSPLSFSEMVFNEINIRAVKEFKPEKKIISNCYQGTYEFMAKDEKYKGCMEDPGFENLRKSFLGLYTKRLPVKEKN